MLRRILAVAVIVIGLAVMAAAIGSATIWRPADRVTAALPGAPDQPYLVTAPGVLDLADDEVDVRVIGASADSPLVLAMGREADVYAWLGDSGYLEVTGLTEWEVLSVREVEGTTTEAEGETGALDLVTDPAGSDLWIQEITGTGELTYHWTSVPGRWVMLVATDGVGPAPDLELTWDREVGAPLLVPGLIAGAMIGLIGLIALVLVLLVDRETARARRAREEARRAGADVPARRSARHRGQVDDAERSFAEELGVGTSEEVSTDTGELPSGTVDDDGRMLTRRELRERERALTQTERGRGRRPGPAPIRENSVARDAGMTVKLASEHEARSEQASESGAPELSDWIAASSTTQEADPRLTSQAARSADGQHARSQTDDISSPADSSIGQPASAPAGGILRWWRRWRGQQPEQPIAEPPRTQVETPETDGETRPDPHASGERWRRTWGIGGSEADSVATPDLEDSGEESDSEQEATR